MRTFYKVKFSEGPSLGFSLGQDDLILAGPGYF